MVVTQIFDRNPSELCTEIVVDDDNTQNRFHYRVQDTPGAVPGPVPSPTPKMGLSGLYARCCCQEIKQSASKTSL